MNSVNFYNEEYEKSIIGIMLLDNSMIDVIKIKLDKSAFYNAKYNLIYRTIIEQWERHHCVTTVSLMDSLRHDMLPAVMDCTEIISSANWEFYVTKINEYALARKMRNDLSSVIATLQESNIKDKFEELNSLITSYAQIGGTSNQSTQNLCVEITEEVFEAAKHNDLYLGFDTGWGQLNEITDGFQTKNLYVLGARPSIGKTACALNLLANLCKKEIPCGFISLEMSNKSLLYRMISSEAKLPAWQIKKGICLSYKDGLNKFQRATEKVFNFPLNIFDHNVKTDAQILSCIRYEAKINGTKFFVIDHLALVKISNPTAQRYADIGVFTSSLKDLAKELDICILLLCQCGREAEGKKPNMALLRESGNIEQDADVIMFLHRERDMEADSIPTELIVEKNRDGKLGTVKLNYLGQYTKFVEDVGLKNNEIGKAPDLRSSYSNPEPPKEEKKYETETLPF